VKEAPPIRGKQSTKHLDAKRTGRAPTWDIVRGESYWKTKPDMTATEIADRVGTTPANLTDRAKRCGWGPRPTKATSPTTTKKCRACGSTVSPGQACPACGVTA
jgi:ribosomal protein L32